MILLHGITDKQATLLLILLAILAVASLLLLVCFILIIFWSIKKNQAKKIPDEALSIAYHNKVKKTWITLGLGLLLCAALFFLQIQLGAS